MSCDRPKETAMDIDTVRDRATAFCEALDAGDVDAATAHLSPELRRNLGEVLALLPRVEPRAAWGPSRHRIPVLRVTGRIGPAGRPS
jgi:hypothetical protein